MAECEICSDTGEYEWDCEACGRTGVVDGEVCWVCQGTGRMLCDCPDCRRPDCRVEKVEV